MNATRICAREAERMLGRRLDRRVAYWKRGDDICVLGTVVRSIAEAETNVAKFYREHPDRLPSASAYARPLVERARADNRIDLGTDLVVIGQRKDDSGNEVSQLTAQLV